MLDSSVALADLCAQGHGIALLPARLFASWENAGRLIRPFSQAVEVGSYWITRPVTRQQTTGMQSFTRWLCETAASG